LDELGIDMHMNKDYEDLFKNINQTYAEKEYALIIKEIESIVRNSW
jgi:hypothetical protein